MKKTQLKSLSLHKKTISNLKDYETVKGGLIISLGECLAYDNIQSVIICKRENQEKSVSNIICW